MLTLIGGFGVAESQGQIWNAEPHISRLIAIAQSPLVENKNVSAATSGDLGVSADSPCNAPRRGSEVTDNS